jgi:O-glycosyl hydrolase
LKHLILFTQLIVIFAFGNPQASTPATTVTINFKDTLQTFDGWGTSLCWWAVRVGNWSDKNLSHLTSLITNPDTGLGLSIFRYNIGGGDEPSHTHMRTGGNVPGYKARENAAYDWNADPNQRAVLVKLIKNCPNAVLEAFSNSPPWWMTKSGCSSGNTDGSNNLKDDYYDDFANYLVDVVKHFKDQWGITFSTLEPLNESEADWWKSKGSQEGCHFDRSSQDKIIKEVYKSLKASALEKIKISADDANSIDACLANLNGWSAEALACLGQINTHSYNGTKRTALRTRANALKLPLYQSESGPLSWSGNSVFDAALFMSRRIIKDLYEMQAQAWTDWQLLDDSQNWQLFSTNWTGEKCSPSTNFFARASFSRFIRPAWKIVTTNNSDITAAVSPSAKDFGIIILNESTGTKNYTFTFTNIDTSIHAAELYSTTENDHCVLSKVEAITDKKLTCTVPSRALISIRPQINRIPAVVVRNTQGVSKDLNYSVMVNPNDHKIDIVFPRESRWNFKLFGFNGTKIYSKQLPRTKKYTAVLPCYSSGTFILSIEDDNKTEKIQKVFFWR